MDISALRLERYLNQQGVVYETILHRPDFTAMQAAIDTGTPPGQFVKSVLLVVDGRFVMTVLPSNRIVDLAKVCKVYGAREVDLATEDDLQDVSEECEVGAAPPFGNPMGITLLMQPELCVHDTLTFNAGTHEKAIRMGLIDFLKLTQPRMADISL